MLNYSRHIVIFITAFCLMAFKFGCNKRATVEEFVKSVQDDKDFNRVHEDPAFIIRCNYMPAQMLAISELRPVLENKKETFTREHFEQIRNNFSDAVYFTLNIGRTDQENIITAGLSNREDYAMLTGYLTYNLDRDVYLLTKSGDTVRPLLYNYQNSYGYSPNAVFLLAFPKSVLDISGEHIEFIYSDKIFGLTETARFRFSKKALCKELPELKFSLK